MFTQENVFQKLWRLLRTYILTVPRFDLFLQGTLLILILLDHNVYLLLQRDADDGYHPPLVKDWVFLSVSGTEFLLGVLVAWSGRKHRNFALSYWLLITAASALLVLAFPFDDEVSRAVGICDNDQSQAPSVSDSNIVPRTIMLVSTAVLSCLAKVSIWSHGLTYLDDHEPQNGPYFYGILISIRLSLGLSGQAWLIPGGYTDDWWVAHLCLGMLTLMFSVLFTLFPKEQPGYEPPVMKDDDGLLPSVCRVLRNKAIMLQIGALALLNIAVFCFVDYNHAFIQARFHIETIRADPRTATLVGSIFRPMVIIFFVMIFRVRFSVRRSDGVKANTAARVGGVVAVFAAIFVGVLAVLSCGIEDIEGTGVDSYEQPSCSQSCGCNSELYGFAPLCDFDSSTTYFSPCHAGCSAREEIGGLTFFSNCTCGIERAYRGACTIMSCQTIYAIYQALFTVTLAIAGSAFMMQGMVLLRAADHHDKAVAVGTGFSLVALLSHVLGYLLYMLISGHCSLNRHLTVIGQREDPTCPSCLEDEETSYHLVAECPAYAAARREIMGSDTISEDVTCMYKNDGACLLHYPTIWWMPVASAIMAVLSAAVSLLASRVAYSVDELRVH